MRSEKKSVTHNLTHAQNLNLHLYDEQWTTSKAQITSWLKCFIAAVIRLKSIH